MSAYLTLMKLSIRNRIGAFRRDSWYKSSGKLDVSRIVTTVIILLSFVYLGGLVIWAEVSLFGAMASAGQPMLLVALTLLMGIVSTLMLGVFMVTSTLYYHKDSPWFAFLPVSPYAVLGMRWTAIWAGDAALNLVLIGPAALMYGLYSGANVLYYLRMISVILATPLMPLSVATLIASILARTTVRFRNKDAMAMVGSLLVVFMVVGLEMAILPRIPEDADAMYIVQMLLSQEKLINLLLGSFPPVLWAAKGIAGNWGLWLLFMLVSVSAAAAALIVTGRGYMNTCMLQSEHASRRKKVRTRHDPWRARSPLMALYLREWNEILKTPVYAMNSLVGVVMVPLMMVIIGIGVQSSGESTALIIPLIQNLLSHIASGDLVLILTAILCFACMMNPVAATSVSREGQRLPLSRMIPVSARTQMYAKLLVGMTVSFLTQAAMLILMIVALRDYALWLAPAMLLATLLSGANCALALTLDSIRPMLHWANETQAMKQNFNFAIMMLVTLLQIAAPAAVAILLANQSAAVRLAAAVVIVLAEAALAWLAMEKIAVGRYGALEG